MITEHDLAQAIAECQGERNPNANTCIKLAAFYTIRDAMFGKAEQLPAQDHPGYSYDAGPTIEYNSDTEFSSIITGRDPAEVWPVMDELMSTIKALIPRLYDGVMRKLSE